MDPVTPDSPSSTNAPLSQVPATGPAPNAWLGRAAESRQVRDNFFQRWKLSVDDRVQLPFAKTWGLTVPGVGEANVAQVGGGRDQRYNVTLAEDWSRTKQKTAQLMFQVPRVVAKPLNPAASEGAGVFSAKLNLELGPNGVNTAFMMDECLADVINAAGLAVSVVGYETLYTTTKVPSVPPEFLVTLQTQGITPDQIQAKLADGTIPSRDQIEVTAEWYYMRRLAPNCLLWPMSFTGSNWDDAPWLGYDTYMPTTLVKQKWGTKLPEGWKSGGGRPQTLAEDLMPADQQPEVSSDFTKVTVIWYHGYLYQSSVKHPDELWTVIFVEGCTEAVEDAPTKWQKWVPPSDEARGHFLGITKFPIRVDTLVYVSDLAVPPSDTEAGRPYVYEMMTSRGQQLRQRDSSIPVRWYDTNRVDEDVIEQIKLGEIQDMIPMNGPGDRAIGEVARANYPRENFEFQRIIGQDLDRAWAQSNLQLGNTSAGRRSATEVNTVQGASDTRLEYEKARMERFLLGNVEVLAGLMQMFETQVSYVEMVGPDQATVLQAFSNKQIASKYAFELIPDSSEHIDVETRINRVLKLYNLAANSPGINRAALEKELVELLGMDPRKIIAPPMESKPERPKVSFSFKGEDMSDPIAVAMMTEAGYKITPEMIKQAQLMIMSAATPAPTHVALPGTPPPAPPDEVTPPDANDPILKRGESGQRFMGQV